MHIYPFVYISAKKKKVSFSFLLKTSALCDITAHLQNCVFRHSQWGKAEQVNLRTLVALFDNKDRFSKRGSFKHVRTHTTWHPKRSPWNYH